MGFSEKLLELESFENSKETYGKKTSRPEFISEMEESKFSMTISERIFELLHQKNMTQKEFSERTQIPQSTISDWKNKKMNPSSDKIMLICDVLRVTPYELLSGAESSAYRQMDYLIVDKKSNAYLLIEKFYELDYEKQNRLIGYMQALMDK